ncbi:MAG: alpha-glucosidase/alpha-galactosidase [Lentisphaerae bacterium]|nr:alpha-glucosidase/alpha-galactosidase [Lentisphaerota bacterium]
MRKKIAFIGAGSFGFTRKLVRDILTFPALQDAEIALMDIDAERLGFIKEAVEKIIAKGNYPAKLTVTMDRTEALKNADGVVITILQGGYQVFKHDVTIPKEYNVDINVGDTRGPAGIFRMLRTLPVMLDICADVEKFCPDAVVLNYTNPMAMLCNGMQKVYPHLNITGLCHSVQGTAAMLAAWIKADMKDITYTCAGINHQAFYLKFDWKGQDAYPLIRKAVTTRKDIYNQELVRNEMFLALDYYVTESSGHNSEYNAWFRKRPDLIEKYCTYGTNWNPGEHAYIVNYYRQFARSWRKQSSDALKEDFPLERGNEYAASIFNGIFGDNTPFEFNGNIPNTGLITNLPEGACVEVPVLASQKGLNAFHVGALPDQLAILCNTSSRCETLALEGALSGDPIKIYQSIIFDPLTSAVLSLAEIREMVNKMFAANKKYLTYFKSIKVK